VGNLRLTANEVHIWRINLGAEEPRIQRCRGLLSSDEIQRASRFYFEKHRCRFIVARGAMRNILGRYGEFPPQELVFSCGEKGKPELSGALGQCGIKFNLSHAHDIALLAVAQGLDIGVDVEFVDPEFGSEEIASRFFSTSEINALLALPSGARTEAFFSCWTRKEAYIKARGDGLSIPLDSFQVAFGPGVPATILQVRVDPGEVSRWSIYDIEVGAGYKAAVVVAGNGHFLRHLEWETES
jgi:4'-phosphopantetheinyl transferase